MKYCRILLEKLAACLLLVSILFFTEKNVFPQPLSCNVPVSQYTHKIFTDDDRLNNVLDVAQDNDGFLWLATYSGLVRFDSKEFVYYNSSTRDDFPVSSVRTLMKDKDGILWIGTNDSGLFLYKE
jgi:ligand-binding sensor domain-containing protein